MTIKEIEIQLALGTLTRDMKYELANNEKTSKKILTILSTDKDWYIRSYVAENSNTPKRILTKLFEDEHWCVKYCSLQKLMEQDEPNEQTS